MPKRVPKEAKRVPLNCLVLPETLAWLRSVEGSQGGAVDLAVAALRMQESVGRPPVPVLHVADKPKARPFKGELLKPSAKKKS